MAIADNAVIIKRKKVVAGDGHHGGAWKVAYADFVTAMMAFFLLMWLLNATSEEQRKGLADYFSPSLAISESSSGGKALFRGDTITASKSLAHDEKGGGGAEGEDGGEVGGPKAEPEPQPDPVDIDPIQASISRARAEFALRDREVAIAEADIDAMKAAYAEALARAEAAEAELAAVGAAPSEFERDGEKTGGAPNDGTAEKAEFEAAFDALREVDEGEALLEHLSLKLTPEGLRIEIAETAKAPLFQSGSSEPSPLMRALIEVVAPVIAKLENEIAITGHTDAKPYRKGAAHDNWTLSADRADAARRLLIAFGLPEARLARVAGAAAQEPLVDDVYAPENRRIAITLLRLRRAAAPPE